MSLGSVHTHTGLKHVMGLLHVITVTVRAGEPASSHLGARRSGIMDGFSLLMEDPNGNKRRVGRRKKMDHGKLIYLPWSSVLHLGY